MRDGRGYREPVHRFTPEQWAAAVEITRRLFYPPEASTTEQASSTENPQPDLFAIPEPTRT